MSAAFSKRLKEAEELIRLCDSPDGFCGEMPDEIRDRIEDFLAGRDPAPSPDDAVRVVRAESGKDRIDFELDCGHIVGLARADVASFNSNDELELPTALACPVCPFATAEGVFV